ncbi:uncharacterized protein LOC135947315 [Cloeon dipterum]|uniref:uncharacterized protein LOC135947315 n=1 Tax=Cloeon dipterum TaxID=197152 RepID=UPI00321F6AA6
MARQQHKGALDASPLYNVVRYQLVPPVFLLLFTAAVQILAALGQGRTPCPLDFGQCHRILGNDFAWIFVAFSILWAVVWLWVPGKIFVGPPTPEGYRPPYKANGFLYYAVTSVTFMIAQNLYPSLSRQIYESMPEILGCFNNVALLLCAWLLLDGRRKKKSKNPLLYDFYRGCELHPRLFGCDVKQLTNCRIGLMLWQILVLAFWSVQWENGSGVAGASVSAILQTIYLSKFFHWETGYFNTLDITYDRAGYYLCWGCLVWVPILYTFHSYHQVTFPSTMSPFTAAITLLLGIGCVLINYRIDYEKQVFSAWWNSKERKAGKGGKAVKLWGRPATYIPAPYTDATGAARESALLTSGCWGIARHGNYTFELLCTLCWTIPAASGHGPIPSMFYFFFLAGLLVHRVYRDEDKCQAKYGKTWDKYTKTVPNRMLPYIY